MFLDLRQLSLKAQTGSGTIWTQMQLVESTLIDCCNRILAVSSTSNYRY